MVTTQGFQQNRNLVANEMQLDVCAKKGGTLLYSVGEPGNIDVLWLPLDNIHVLLHDFMHY